MSKTPPLRVVKVHFTNGDTLTTSMNGLLTDQQIKDYYKIGRYFNLGAEKDNMQQVIKVEIIK